MSRSSEVSKLSSMPLSWKVVSVGPTPTVRVVPSLYHSVWSAGPSKSGVPALSRRRLAMGRLWSARLPAGTLMARVKSWLKGLGAWRKWLARRLRAV